MAEKIKCYVEKKMRELTPAAFRIAERHFGAVRITEKELIKPAKPIELRAKAAPVEVVKDEVAESVEAEISEYVQEEVVDTIDTEELEEEATEETPQPVVTELPKPKRKRKPRKK